MSCCRLTSAIVGFLAVGCSDQRLTVLPIPPADTAAEPGDTVPVNDDSEGRPEETGNDETGGEEPACAPGELGEADGLPLRRSEDVEDPETGFAAWSFSYGVLPAVSLGNQRVWVTTNYGWYADTRPNWDGAYLLDATDWQDSLLGPDILPTFYMEDPVGAQMIAGGLTVDSGSPGEAVWVSTPSTEADEWDGTRLWVSAANPTRGVDLASWAAAEVWVASREADESGFGDYDGDGLDDALLPGYQTIILLAPFAGTLSDADADVVFPERLSGGVADFRPTDHAALDLDGDGYLDLVWKQANGERDDHTQFDLMFKRGPVATDPVWDTPDAVFVDEVSRMPHADGPSSLTQYSSVRAVGDVTGDGLVDATATYGYDGGGEPGSSSLFVIDRLPEGTGAILDLETRLVGALGDDPSSPDVSALGSGGGGDVNGDGFGDLVAFQQSTELASGSEHRAYVVTGPLSGLVLLEESGVQVRLPHDTGSTYERNTAALLPDFDGDGMDDVIVNVVDGTNPGTAWLFPGCSDW